MASAGQEPVSESRGGRESRAQRGGVKLEVEYLANRSKTQNKRESHTWRRLEREKSGQTRSEFSSHEFNRHWGKQVSATQRLVFLVTYR